ncbi:3-phosphoshikimate 1-carboxyvinyltransferase [Dethiothermospora halolimnae]|uniref:3-phosphoshikimate 1-carboxyvinyltransferase n=1 Tax=Dethiothermospora halolimnae TaxID=3114390 RepID=UPI003CCB75DC
MKIKGENKPLKGEITVPGDKSISHRSIMLGAISNGETIVSNFLMGQDCISTINCFRKLGVNIEIKEERIIIDGVGLNGLKEATTSLDVGNSGTTIRLISGILSGQNFSTTITGDDSIKKRPMKRIMKPLSLMGGNITGIDNNYPPLKINPVDSIKGITYHQPIASAQVKSAILLAGLYANEETKVVQPSLSRDHTERMLKHFGGDINTSGKMVTLKPKKILKGKEVLVPGDISSAAFFIVGGLITKGSQLTIRDVGLNETRIGIIEVLKNMGGYIKVENKRLVNNEPIGDITVEYSELKGVAIKGDIIPKLIDEIPIIAVAASVAKGTTIIKDAEELKVKESNRLDAMVKELKKMGADIKGLDDGMIISGVDKLKGAKVETYKDHRIAMSLAIASSIADGESEIDNIDSIDISFPGFFDLLNKIK